MLPILLACLKNNLEGGGGGGPFTITGVNVTYSQHGTSCSVPMQLNVSLAYTGSVSGITLKLEKSVVRDVWTTVDTGMLPTDFPHVEEIEGYYNQFGSSARFYFRVTDESDVTNTATSAAFNTVYTICA